MKRSLFILSAAVIGLSLFGWGCTKQSAVNRVGKTNTQTGQTATTVKQTGQAATTTTSEDVTPQEPVALAYLQLTQGAAATVSRGDQSIDAANDMELYVGDKVNVTAGEVRLLYPDAGLSMIEAPATFSLTPQGETEQGVGVRILLEAGKVWTRLERLLGSDEEFSVQASDVVATVRGTAFGVALAGGNVDVSVAESQVKVDAFTRLNMGDYVTSTITLGAGNTVGIAPDDLSKMGNVRATMLRKIRKVTDAEKAEVGYRFALRKFDAGALKRPAKPFRWAVPPALDAIRDRLQAAQLKRWEAFAAWMKANRSALERAQAQVRLEQLPARFAAPTRQILQLELAAPTTTPKILNPPTLIKS